MRSRGPRRRPAPGRRPTSPARALDLGALRHDDEAGRRRELRFRPLEGLVDVLMSSSAWDAYAVPGTPYFVHVVDGIVVGEGSGTAWTQVASMLTDALAERDLRENRLRVDAALQAAGIGAGHPSLHPVRSAGG